jgi:hypothetical protein
MTTEMLWASLVGRSRTNSPRQRFHSQMFGKSSGISAGPYTNCTIYVNTWDTKYTINVDFGSVH